MAINAAVREDQFVVFKLAGQEYGIAISRVNKIIQVEEITRIPQTPDFVEGVINLRGDVISVLSLSKRFNISGADSNEAGRIIIVEIGGILVGVLVDEVLEVLRVPAEKIEPAPQMSGDKNFIQGIALIDKRMIILLDINRILYEEEKNVLELLEKDLMLTS